MPNNLNDDPTVLQYGTISFDVVSCVCQCQQMLSVGVSKVVDNDFVVKTSLMPRPAAVTNASAARSSRCIPADNPCIYINLSQLVTVKRFLPAADHFRMAVPVPLMTSETP